MNFNSPIPFTKMFNVTNNLTTYTTYLFTKYPVTSYSVDFKNMYNGLCEYMGKKFFLVYCLDERTSMVYNPFYKQDMLCKKFILLNNDDILLKTSEFGYIITNINKFLLYNRTINNQSVFFCYDTILIKNINFWRN